MGQHLSTQLRALEEMLSRQEARASSGGPAPAALALPASNGPGDVDAKLAQVDEKIAMVLRGQEQLQRAIAMLASTQAGALTSQVSQPTYSSAAATPLPETHYASQQQFERRSPREEFHPDARGAPGAYPHGAATPGGPG